MAPHPSGGAAVLHDARDTAPASAWLPEDPRSLDWNGPTDRPFTRVRDEDLERPIIEHFERIARQQPDRVAVRAADHTLTFEELWRGVSGLAERLTAETKRGDLIGILLPASPLFPLAMLACLAAGRPFVALDTRHPPDWLEHVLEEARPALIITSEDGHLAGDARVIRLTGVPLSARHDWRPATMTVDEPACVLFTSGSTGRPKSIVNSQRNVLQRVAQSINAAHINASDRLLTLASPCTIVGVRDVMTALLAGASIHLLDPLGVGAREILDVSRTEAVTILFAFPALLRSIVPVPAERAVPSLRLVRLGGDTTLWSDIDTLRAWLPPDAGIQVVYAATEAPMLQWFVDDNCRRDDVRVPIGYPLPGNHLALVDEEGRATAAGEVGEILVSSPYVSLGPWIGGRLVDARDDRVNARGWPTCRTFHTGDLGRQRSDGLLERVGRKDRQVKIQGSRVDLDGVEAMLRGHPRVRDVAAIARQHDADGSLTLVAYVAARGDASGELHDELKVWVRSAPPPMRPARFYPASSIPRLPNSKLDLRALAALDEATIQRERTDAIDAAAPTTIHSDPVAQTVARVWHNVLRVPVRTAEDDFFDSGGDSLSAIAFVIELERELGLDISLTLINEAPRFDRLCQALSEQRPARSTPLITLKDGDDLPPLFFIHGVGGNVVEILPAARRVGYRGPVIGIRGRGIVRGETPHTTIEAMAADYLQAIKERQPSGPYYLCGYSSGRLVAFEIARQLSESNEAVGLVGLFDTTMSPVRWPLRTWRSIASRRVALLAAALRAPLRTWPARMRHSAAPLRAWRDGLGAAPFAALRVAASTLIASAKYHPGFYRGQLTLFSPAEREPGLPSLDSIWRAHARTVVVVETPGSHATMLSTRHAATTAACVTRQLPAASVA